MLNCSSKRKRKCKIQRCSFSAKLLYYERKKMESSGKYINSKKSLTVPPSTFVKFATSVLAVINMCLFVCLSRAQVWHWCVPSGQKYSFLCPNQTVFNQLVRVCDWWFNVDCPSSRDHYNNNEDLYKDKDGNRIWGHSSATKLIHY